MELTKQQDYQAMEDAAKIWIDMMSVNYGIRTVEVKMDIGKPGEQPLGMNLPEQVFMQEFDFSQLKEVQLAIRQDVGASSYWSEMASMQTLDNLLMNDRISLKQYLERLPNGYLSKKQELLDEIAISELAMSMPPSVENTGTGMSVETTSDNMAVRGGSGNGSLQRALNREGA